MRFSLEKDHRRSLRLEVYDYSQAGAYFVTLCTKDREGIFGEIAGGSMRLSPFGEILKLAVKSAGYDVLSKGDAAAWQAVETQGFHKLKNYKVEGLHGPVTYTPGDNRLDKFNRIYRITDGEIGDPSKWVEAPLVKYEEYDWFGK